VDVRAALRRQEDGLVPDAVLADRDRIVDDFGFASTDRLPEVMGPDQEIVVFCTSEKGSTPAVNQLVELGFDNVFHIRGGFRAWADAGLPTVPPPAAAGDSVELRPAHR
jgi:rhodanese-related sulfurtransferase